MTPHTPLATLLLAFGLAACARTPAGPPPQPATDDARPAAERLAGYHWRLQDATDPGGRRIDALLVRHNQPIQLDFADGRIGVSNACNQIGGMARIEADRIRIEDLVSTKMACLDPAISALDDEIGRRLRGVSRFAIGPGDAPLLIWTAANGDILRFVGAPTPATRFGQPGEVIFLEVAARTRRCQRPLSPVESDCLEVRELRYDEGQLVGEPGPWQPFGATIDGYRHEPGIRNVLRVRRFTLANAPADTPQVAYVHEATIESEAVEP